MSIEPSIFYDATTHSVQGTHKRVTFLAEGSFIYAGE